MSTEKNTYHKYETYEDRLAAWKKNRASYNTWRKTREAYRFIEWKRKKQQNLCFICLLPLEQFVHVDHIFPLYLGGTNFKGNMCLTHPKCNMDKGTKVYSTYKQTCKRRHQFNVMRKAKRAQDRLKRNPKTKLSKKDLKAIKLLNKLQPQ